MILDELRSRQLHKFTGPPENWITAIKFMTWGLEEKYRKQWANILPGDIFLMHSTSTNTKVKGAKSAVIGFGVVGDNPTVKSGPLWIQEYENNRNTWPLLVPFSEIYLFSPFFEKNTVPTPALDNVEQVAEASRGMLHEAIPLSVLSGFPQMGSFSSVKQEVVAQIFQHIAKLYVIGQENTLNDYIPTPFAPLNNIKDQTRYSTSLQTLEEVKSKTFTAKGSTYAKDPVLLERAESAHQSTLEKLMNLFKEAGYDTYFNKHVDLFALKGDMSFLFEVKSNENNNFLPQARKGIVQLFEYEHFEIQKFFRDKSTSAHTFKNLAFSQKPANIEYAQFMNVLNLGVSYFEHNKLKAFGNEIGISSI